MILPLNLDVSQTYQKQNCIRLTSKDSVLNEFPIAFLGENSYIVSSTVSTAFEYRVQTKYSLENNDYNLRFSNNIQVGKYCGLAHGLNFILSMNHDYNKFFQNPVINTNIQDEISNKLLILDIIQKGQIIIQNDVWVGFGVSIMGGVKIGNGAIIAANSVVTKNVEPYSIVAGNPAKHIRYRFDENIIEKLQMIQWWFWGYDKIVSSIDKFSDDIEGFVDNYYEESLSFRDKITNYSLEIPNDKTNFIYFEDSKEKFSTIEQVLVGFVDYFKNNSTVRLIIYTTKDDQNQINKILQSLDGICEIYVYHQQDKIDELAIFKYAKYYITNRTHSVNLHSCYADIYGLKTISCVDIPLIRDNIL